MFIDGYRRIADEKCIIGWDELKELLNPINRTLAGRLIVCMSSCNGFSGIRMAMHPEDDVLPFFALIGCADKPTWAETAVGYTTLYHQLCIGEHIRNAESAMQIASGNTKFFLEYGADSRQYYLDQLAAPTLSEVQEIVTSASNDGIVKSSVLKEFEAKDAA